MGKLNFFAGIDVLNVLLSQEYDQNAVPPLDLTMDLPDLPFWFGLTTSEKTQTLKIFKQMEMYSKAEEHAITVGSVVLDHETGNASD